MTNFRIFDGNANQFDLRDYGPQHQTWTVGTYVPFITFMDDVRIFVPKLFGRGMLNA